MNSPSATASDPAGSLISARSLAELAFSRAAGAPLVCGNSLRLLLDGAENYDAWRAAIRSATHTVLFENYIISADTTGRSFLEELTRRAADGVKVRVMLDWLGSFSTPRRFWGPLVKAGGTVRYHNPPSLGGELSWFSRDHRKSLVVDGRIGFISGVCVSDVWLGDPKRRIEPWRDTGVELRGPAVTDLVRAFSEVWAQNGPAIPPEELAAFPDPENEGGVALRVIATAPSVTGLYRLDLLIASLAQHRLWLTDAYFAGTPSYVQALRAAARDGVDVRLLVPGGSDLPWLRPLTTAGYRPLLEAGVRVFEWNGSMLHAKTAVADDHWARVGSTNLNMASWLTNFELDVAVDDAGFASQMAAAYERDLTHATEIVLKKRRRMRIPSEGDTLERSKPAGGSLTRATAGALRFSRAVSAAMSGQRVLDAGEVFTLLCATMLALVIAGAAVIFPRVAAGIVATTAALAALFLIFRAVRTRALRKRKRKAAQPA
ncbi:MAG: phospholipase D-like domain-containing protein [Chthoniobacteraceae bacterium]